MNFKYVNHVMTVTALFFMSGMDTFASSPSFDTKKIETMTGVEGTTPGDGVFKLNLPRTDIPVSVDQWVMPPFMGVASWISFRKGIKEEIMLMGDLALFQDEVNAVIDVLQKGGLEVTALHNHFFFDAPRLYFMHIAGEGGLENIAKTIKTVLEKIREVRSQNKVPAESFSPTQVPAASFAPPQTVPKNQISPAPLEQIFGQKVDIKDGMCKAVFGRTAKMGCGCEIGKDMGVNSWAAFAGTNDNAIVTGDFSLEGEEVQNAIKILRGAGINIIAIHHHMIGESPKYYFVHFWGRGKVEELAKAIKGVVDNWPSKK